MYTNESGLIDDVYDYMFGNDANIGTDFLSDDFAESYVDTDNHRIYLNSKELGNFIIKIEKA